MKIKFYNLVQQNRPKMKITNDVYSFDLLKDGTDVSEVKLNSSGNYLNEMKERQLIRIEYGKIFLTDKGGAAKKIGLDKYLKLEEYEQRVSRWNTSTQERDMRFIKLVAVLILIFAFLLAYVNFLLN